MLVRLEFPGLKKPGSSFEKSIGHHRRKFLSKVCHQQQKNAPNYLEILKLSPNLVKSATNYVELPSLDEVFYLVTLALDNLVNYQTDI